MTHRHDTLVGMGSLTNEDFAALVGCSPSMVSRMRGGARRPSAQLRDTITTTFGLDPAEVIQAYSTSGGFARFLQDRVFSRPRACVLEHPDVIGPCDGEDHIKEQHDSQHEPRAVHHG